MSETPPRRLLILSCSDRKNDVAPDSPQQLFSFMTTRRARSLAAWEIYAGVAFQVVKRCQREGAFPLTLTSGSCPPSTASSHPSAK